MALPFQKTLDNYTIMYRFSNEPYKPKESWTTTKTFTPDSKLDKTEFIPEKVLEKPEFVLNPEWCR